MREFNSLFEYTFERLIKNDVFAQSITIKMRYTSFKTYTKSKKLKFSTRNKDFLYNEMLELINSFEKEDVGDYDRDNGFVRGAVTLSYEIYKMTQDRGRTFNLDAMDVDESNFIANAGNVMRVFSR